VAGRKNQVIFLAMELTDLEHSRARFVDTEYSLSGNELLEVTVLGNNREPLIVATINEDVVGSMGS
jgi:hypothetical protein